MESRQEVSKSQEIINENSEPIITDETPEKKEIETNQSPSAKSVIDVSDLLVRASDDKEDPIANNTDVLNLLNLN